MVLHRARGYMRTALSEPPSCCVDGLRIPGPADMSRLAVLMQDAYAGTVDEEDETLEATLAEVRKTFRDGYGAFLPHCSAVIERDGHFASAILVTRWQRRPFVAFLMTAPAWKRHGLARACLAWTMHALWQRGESELRLAVTLANTPALRLYESLGFRMET